MTGEAIQILTPVGRLVQGHPMLPTQRKDKDKKLVIDPKTGQPAIQYYCAIAFPKSDGIFDREIWPQLRMIAQRDWPTGEYNAETFAWKVLDGDGRDRRGQPRANHPGWAGMWVMRLASNFPYAVVDAPQKANVPLVDKNQLKPGYYVRACFNALGNGPNESPGLYLNPIFVQLIGYGPEIILGPDVGAILAAAGAPPPLPPGASLQPVAPVVGGGAPPPPPPVAYAPPPVAMPAYTPPPVAMPAYTPPPPPPAPPTVFPPPGWLAHPTHAGYYYQGQIVKSEAELRAVQPHNAILTPPGH